MAYAELLALKGKVTQAQVARLREGSGYRDLIGDLGALVQILTGDPSLLAAGAPVTAAEVQRASDVAFAMNTALGTDADSEKSHSELMVERQKLANLLDASHRELRRGMDFIRFYEGDAAQFVPSLRVPGPGRRRSPAEDPSADPSFTDQHEQAHAAFAHPDDNPFTTES